MRKWLPLVFIVATLAFTIAVYNRLPEEMVIHWNASGQPDGYGSRAFGAFLLPVVVFGIWGLMVALPRLDVEKVDAEITGFEAACVHPELVFLNFALSTSQAGGLVDVSGAISRNLSSSALHSLQWLGLEQQVAEPRFTPLVPANFLARCEDLSLSTEVDLFAGDLVFAAAAISERSTFSGPAAEGTAKLSGPRLGTAFPDRLFIEAGHADEAQGQGWTAGQLVGAGPQGHDSSGTDFPPMNAAGRSRSMQESLARAGVFEPVLETKRPMDRDLADFV